MIAYLVSRFLRLGIIWQIPAGITPDNVGAWGVFGLAQNVNNYSESLSSVASSGTALTLIAASAQAAPVAGNVLAGFTQVNAGATAGLTVTLPSTQAIIGALGNTVPPTMYSEPIHIINNSGQTITLAAGDANTALLGSNTIAVGSIRKMILQVLNSSTLSITNVGTWTL